MATRHWRRRNPNAVDRFVLSILQDEDTADARRGILATQESNRRAFYGALRRLAGDFNSVPTGHTLRRRIQLKNQAHLSGVGSVSERCLYVHRCSVPRAFEGGELQRHYSR